MRKVIWCCSAAGVLTAGTFLSLAYYACCFPDSLVGRSMQVIAEASVAMQPLNGITSMAMRTCQANTPAHSTATPIDECIPDDPQPVMLEQREQLPQPKEVGEPDAAPIVINENNFELDTVPVVPAPKDLADMQGQEIPPKGTPLVMPYCREDDDGPTTPPKMPRAEADQAMKHTVFKAWMELFEEGKGNKSAVVEELPPPIEEDPQAEPKCQEDRHLHEQYPGCPRTTCPYSKKDDMEQYYKRVWDLNFRTKKKGGEESSEEPSQPGKKPQHEKDKGACPRTKGVDTMEYRPSDAGLDEYGPGQIH
ncbi:MAG TPA: hypothetical protein VH592_22480 [Gemmataceae bacterium]|jgi:hypothetical protein